MMAFTYRQLVHWTINFICCQTKNFAATPLSDFFLVKTKRLENSSLQSDFKVPKSMVGILNELKLTDRKAWIRKLGNNCFTEYFKFI